MASDKELKKLKEEAKIMIAAAKSLLDNATRFERSLEQLSAPALPSGNVLTALDKQQLRDGLRKQMLNKNQSYGTGNTSKQSKGDRRTGTLPPGKV